jgi:hypothetical protein
MNDDIWDSIDNVELPTGTYFGKVNFDVWYCVLRKGEGAVPFDPNQHSLEERRTQIHIMITPLSSSRAQFLTERKVLAESREWVKITLPSIKALGLKSARELENKWVQYVMEPTGRTYTDRNGVEKQNTMPKFLAVYDSEEEAEKAKKELYAKSDDEVTPVTNGNGAVNGNAERKVAELFLKSLIQTVGKDRQKVAALLASQPLVSKYFTIDSPEVQTLLQGD